MAEHTVCITGANGFIASHVVKQCLAKGWKVRGTVRSVTDDAKVAHLKALPGADTLLELFEADLINAADFVEPIRGCDGVFHTATPVVFGPAASKSTIYDPAMAGTKAILETAAAGGTVKTFVLTSSMSAVAPVPEPSLKNEGHWSDPELQRAGNNWYGCTKTEQEQMVQKFTEEMDPAVRWRYAAICPTGVVGRMLQPKMNAVMGWMAGIINGKMMDKCKNDSMSFIDVEDTAAIHIAAFENREASGRYMCVEASLHWNEIVDLFKQNYPAMTAIPHCDDAPVTPTQFDRTKQDSLGVTVKTVPAILAGVVAELDTKGLLTK